MRYTAFTSHGKPFGDSLGFLAGLDRLELAGTGVARVPVGASISNVICEGRK
jgi:hypothetical protein